MEHMTIFLGTVFNVATCLYSQIYLAKKLSRQVASTTIIGAIINIVINVIFIKQLGLYAAAISTMISYFVMMAYRHIDIKKYVSIKVDKFLVINTILVFTFSIILYYQHNLILNIINLVVVCLYAFLLNKEFLFKSLKAFTSKLKR